MPTPSTMKFNYKPRKPMKAFRTKSRRSTASRVYKRRNLTTLFPRQLTGKFRFFKSIANSSIATGASARYVLYGTDISPYSTSDNAVAVGAGWTYQNVPVNPDTYYNGIGQYADIYGLAHVLYSKLNLSILQGQNSATGSAFTVSCVVVPVVGETEGGQTIIAKIDKLDGFTYDQLASLKGARHGMIGHAAGGPNKWFAKSTMLTRSMFGVKDVIDNKKLACKMPASDLSSGARQGCVDGSDINGYNASAYYIRIFNNASSTTSVNIEMSMSSIVRLTNLVNDGQSIIPA